MRISAPCQWHHRTQQDTRDHFVLKVEDLFWHPKALVIASAIVVTSVCSPCFWYPPHTLSLYPTNSYQVYGTLYFSRVTNLAKTGRILDREWAITREDKEELRRHEHGAQPTKKGGKTTWVVSVRCFWKTGWDIHKRGLKFGALSEVVLEKVFSACVLVWGGLLWDLHCNEHWFAQTQLLATTKMLKAQCRIGVLMGTVNFIP